MSIKEYQEDGKTLFKIYVHVKSNVDPLIRVQRRKTNIKTYKEAVRDENNKVGLKRIRVS